MKCKNKPAVHTKHLPQSGSRMFISASATIFLIYCFQIGLSKKCYNCNEGTETACGDPFNDTSIPQVDCPLHNDCVKYIGPKMDAKLATELKSEVKTFILKLDNLALELENMDDFANQMKHMSEDEFKSVSAIPGQIGIYRECRPQHTCQEVKRIASELKYDVSCYECAGELCNSFQQVLPSLTIICLLFMALRKL